MARSRRPISGGGGGVSMAGSGILRRHGATAQTARMQNMYYRMTERMRVTVRPFYTPEHSDPMEPRYVFVYRIRIENVGEHTAQLLWRHWFIHDEVAGDSEV